MTHFDYIDLKPKDGVAYLTINHPPANTMNISLENELKEALKILEDDRNTKVIVLQSANEKMFSAGADIQLLERLNPDEMDIFCRKIKQLILSFRKSSKICIASIEGHCLGGGLELAMGCDLRVAKDSNYKLGLPEIKLGLFPGGGGIQLACSIIGLQKAFRLAALGETLTASEALAWGLVDYVLPKEGYAEKLEELASQIAQGPSVAMAHIKRLLYDRSLVSIEDAYENESNIMRELLGTRDFAEGIRAFKEKRSPLFMDE
ncbi:MULTISPECIES: enoyl-CoA hydratase/isomerase family protein [unclassified Paenibacillus]|uniref:enoyl-CoA hydratase/isomerase family protein n=1 Tax=unclassified Paenibacillus TaxID=185978 RepID=UPI001AE9914F|nr:MULTISPECIES: enoyl-CoA hydratase/isomerase family protein [unclassified Paenibacillus]MBP1155357.1 enoyl-CoA hydratase/carnithine racemase [Paenibacillus sp. PvP091]MBP1169259.1 enoyl-CoA hydratase/carnithine racemase [Paenibacillus sp. PvR098]MBP2440286.1 enoyl-CoA hydratase/carnithine racemase [Paenibacillus sp. PvP052]